MRYIDILQEIAEKHIVVSVVILIVLFARLLLKRAPKSYSYVLWFIVAFRMMFDAAFQTKFNVVNIIRILSGTNHNKGMTTGDTTATTSGIVNTIGAVNVSGSEETTVAATTLQNGNAQMGNQFTNTAKLTSNQVNGNLGSSESGQTIDSGMADMMSLLEVIACAVLIIWMTGIVVILAVQMISYIHLRKMTSQAVLVKDNIWECDFISSPFVFGLIRPRIYLPFHLSVEERNYLIAHEYYHIKRRDYVVKTMFFLLVTLYWMNPLVWIAFRMMTRDMEMSCDEEVIRTYGSDIKKIYSSMILNFATKSSVQFSYVAFGEGDAEMRIKNILKFKKLSKGMTAIVIAGVVVCIGVSMSFNFDVKAKENKKQQDIVENSMNRQHNESNQQEHMEEDDTENLKAEDIVIPKVNKTVNISPDNFTDTKMENQEYYTEDELYSLNDDLFEIKTDDEVISKAKSYDELPRYEMGDEVTIGENDDFKLNVVVKDAYVVDCVEGIPEDYKSQMLLNEDGETDWGYLIVVHASIRNDGNIKRAVSLDNLVNIVDKEKRHQGDSVYPEGEPVYYSPTIVFHGTYDRFASGSYYTIAMEPGETYDATYIMKVEKEVYGKELDLLAFPLPIVSGDGITYERGAVIHLNVEGNS